MTSRLKYKILYASSEDPEYPASELLYHSSKTVGWSSSRFCDYPQEIVLLFETAISARQIQFLSHQCRIASKIELFVDDKTDEKTDFLIQKFFKEEDAETKGALQYVYEKNRSQFKRLGYLSLDSNERSQFQARELKSVYIDHTARALRVRLHKCHLNKFNLTNQVCLIAINVLGEKLPAHTGVEKSGLPPGNAMVGGGAVGSFSAAPGALTKAAQAAQRAEFAQYEPKIAEKLVVLSRAKDHAVEMEDYAEAKRYKEMIAKLKAVATRITECEKLKKRAVEAEDYDAAKTLKAEIDALYRAAIEGKDVSSCAAGGAGGAGGGAVHAGAVPPPGMPFHNASTTPNGGQFGGPANGGYAPNRYDSGYQQNASLLPGQSFGDRGNFPGGSTSPGGVFPGASHGAPDISTASPVAPGSATASYAEPIYPNGASNQNDSLVHGGGGHQPQSASDSSGPPRGDMPANNEEFPVGGAGTYNFAAATPGGGRPSGGGLEKGIAQNIGPNTDPNSVKGMHLFKNIPPGAPAELDAPPGGEATGGETTLPEPESISPSFSKEVQPLLNATGDEHLLCCLYSKQRVLREHGLNRLNDELNRGDYDAVLDDVTKIKELYQGLLTVLKRTSVEKNVQIFLLSMQLAQTLCTKVILAGEEQGFLLKKGDTQPYLDGYIPMLVERLGESNARCAQAAGDAVLSFALCPNVNCNYIAQYLMRPIVSKSKKVFPQKVYCNRIKLLTILTQETGPDGFGGTDGFYSQLMAVAMSWFDNPNHEVRQSIVELVGVIYGKTGFAFVAPYIDNLRVAQREVFEAEFERVGGEEFLLEKAARRNSTESAAAAPPVSGASKKSAVSTAKGKSTSSSGAGNSSSSTAQQSQQEVAGLPQSSPVEAAAEAEPSAVNVPANPTPASATAEQCIEVAPENTRDPDEFQCQFCHLRDERFTPEVLDLHYWKDCPLLLECRFCQQVIEVSSLRSHYLEECDQFPMNEIYDLQADPTAPPLLPAPGACPMCQKQVILSEESEVSPEDAWFRHLVTEGCPKNLRKYGVISST
ncbi:unnamed protein product [Amoebophrya sp. A25]|nr:unnamed protein product [Amoebophrya sp. A25]|eukprot:GSA25T00001850001.1